jgi:DNA (cytosine-5)-methyltransferase 1
MDSETAEIWEGSRSPDSAWSKFGTRNDPTAWGKYALAIHRWEQVLGRTAPDPTIVGANGQPRLNPVFVEWMMGLDAGHVTGHGLLPAQELKALGNGVCPQQAHLALRMILGEAS